MNRDLVSQYEPVPFLLGKAEKTDIPLVYLNKKPHLIAALPTVFMLIGPSGSGKDSISDPLYKEGLIVRATTGTSRPRRVEEGEPEERHIWMRQQRDDETIEEYDAHLVQEYGLIEHDRHFGGLYGLPYTSLEKALRLGVPLIRTEVKGVKTITKYLEGKMNCVVVFIVSESLDQIWQRIANRNNIEERKQTALEEIQEAPQVAHYYLFNPIEFEGKPGLEQAQDALKKLIMIYSDHEQSQTTYSG